MYRNGKYMDALTLEQQTRAFNTMKSCTETYAVKRKIVCAANLYHGVLLLGVRHFDHLMNYTIKRLDEKVLESQDFEHEQGFVDQYGVFCDRTEAMQIVKDCGQPFNLQRNGGDDSELFSEGVY